ncbi:hypothetical protein AB0F32_24480 [Streptomyces albidoflavus]|uniref:hypothetical protein n=1 Tax=Streptomyces albidoflavus TaxID=1886 RepID=UPI0033C9597B
MSKRDEQVTEIRNAIERMQSLAEAENLEALEELSAETEKLISALKGVGSVALKTELREEARKASKALREPKPKVHTPGPVEPAYMTIPGVSEMVTLGADMATSGFRAQRKVSELAKDLAGHLLELSAAIKDESGNPDITASRYETMEAIRAVWTEVATTIGQEGPEDETDEERDARAADFKRDIKALQRSVKYHRSSVRADFLRAADTNPERAELFANALKDKPENTPASEHLAAYYSVELAGEREREIERQKRARLGQPEERPAIEAKTPEERVTLTIKALPKAILATPADMELVKADPERREQVAALIDAQVDRLRALRIQLDAE